MTPEHKQTLYRIAGTAARVAGRIIVGVVITLSIILASAALTAWSLGLVTF